MPLVEVIQTAAAAKAPGWAYVPDTGYDPSKAPIQPSARKRNARIAGPGVVELTSRQSNALERRLADLNSDETKAVVPIPIKKQGGRGT